MSLNRLILKTSKLGIKGNFLIQMKRIYQKPSANITFNVQILNSFS